MIGKMLSVHVTAKLSAYCHGELTDEQTRAVSSHLEKCERCRKEYEEIELGVRLAKRLPEIAAPESLWNEIEASLGARAPAKANRTGFISTLRWQYAAVAALAIIGLILGAAVYLISDSRGPWEVEAQGEVTVDGVIIQGGGEIAVGEQLETGAASRAKVRIGHIGEVEIESNSRVRVLEAQPLEHRLELDQGRLHANIWAPPRLFFVNTPSAVAVDLGCAYTLEVNEAGEGRLRVTGGAVQLVLGGRESTVPAEAACETRPFFGPGTPYFEDSPAGLREALPLIDFENGETAARRAALDTVLFEARRRDSLTLWHLLRRLEGSERERVYERLRELVPHPDEVTREGVLSLNEEMLTTWYDYIQVSWFN
jgi:anti-sigma factor RsiW